MIENWKNKTQEEIADLMAEKAITMAESMILAVGRKAPNDLERKYMEVGVLAGLILATTVAQEEGLTGPVGL